MPIDAFLRALMRDVAWGFFYGTVNFDNVFGTVNHYGTVECSSASSTRPTAAATATTSRRSSRRTSKATFEEMLDDWTQRRLRSVRGAGRDRQRVRRQEGQQHQGDQARSASSPTAWSACPATSAYRDASSFPLNRQFLDVPTDKPEMHAEPGFESEVHAFNFFDYLSRSDVTWNPSVVSCVKDSQFCATTEEHILPIIHGNDRVEWFIQVTDEIIWDVEDRATGRPRAKVVMKAGDVAAMPADIRHTGYSPKRSMLIVWENNDAHAAAAVRVGQADAVSGRVLKPVRPVDFPERPTEAPMPAQSRHRDQPRLAGLQIETRLFIGGEFVDAAQGGRIPVTNPHDNSTLAEVAEATAERRRPRRRTPRARRFPAWKRTGRRRSRPPAAEAGRRDRSRRRLPRAARERSTPAIRSATSATSTSPAPRPSSATSAAWPTRSKARVIPVEPGFLNYVTARAARRRRPDRAVEFPADVHQLEDGPGARRRQHRGDEAGGDHAAQRAAHRAS